MSNAARKIRLLMKLRDSGVTDTRVLEAIEKIPREQFLPDMFHDRAYEDTALPIGHGQTISQPYIVGAMTQALQIGPRMKVLEIGTGSGYQAAVLSHICRRVYTIERHKPLLQVAEARFEHMRLRNITTRAGDGMLGWPEVAPFERILVTAVAMREAPQALLEQLMIGGILVIPMGDERAQHIYKITRTDDDEYESEQLMPVRFVPLLPGNPNEAEPSDPLSTLYKHLPKKEHLL
jgi:protein-L-isoaspartate(D-aspartate) O-methyltransferase